MRILAVLAAIATTFGPAAPGNAQDIVGFPAENYGSVVLNKTQNGGIINEMQVGQYNNESIRNYSSDSVFAKMGLSVGRLDILTDKGVFPCTAFIVDDQHLLTNHHCVPGILENPQVGATQIQAVQFVAGYTQQGVDEGTKKFQVLTTPVETSKDLDYSVLKVIGNPSREFGQLRLAANTPHDGDPYWVIGHPMGEAQRISREQCRANRPALSNHRLLHTCDTLPGNSGSPVIDASLQMVVGLHHAGSAHDQVNFAIPMGEILQESHILKAALTTGPDGGGPVLTPAPGGEGADPGQAGETDPVTPVDPPVVTPPVAVSDTAKCDALYQEAKAFGQCFAYEAYLEDCGDHDYSILAKGYIASQCSDPLPPEVVVDPEPPVVNPPAPTPVLLRPWCGNGSLNTTESAICNSAYLARLDADLESAYHGQGHTSSREQNSWRIRSRDGCGADAACISNAAIARIAYLKSPGTVTPSPGTGGTPAIISGTYTLPSSRCYIVTASRPSIAEAKSFVQQWFPGRSGVRIFQSNNGYYGVVVETVSRSASESRIAGLKAQGAVPGDSYCSSGDRYIGEVMYGSTGGSSAPPPQQQSYTMYVDSNNAGAVNVRTGPGTEYNDFTEIRPGTQLTVLRTSGSWSNIRLSNGQTGWVYSPLLTGTRPRAQTCSARVVNLQPYSSASRRSGLGFLNIRADRSARSRILSEAYLGDQLNVLATSGNWVRVQCTSGRCTNPTNGSGRATGWAAKRYLSVSCR